MTEPVFLDTFTGAGSVGGHVADVGTNNANGAPSVVWGCVYDDVVLTGAGEVTTNIIENLTDHGHATCAFDCGELTHNSTFVFDATFPVVVSDNTYRSLTVGIFFNDATNNEHYWAEIYITGRPGYGNCRLTGNGTSINDGELRAMDTAQHSYTLTFDMDGGWVYLDQDLSPDGVDGWRLCALRPHAGRQVHARLSGPAVARRVPGLGRPAEHQHHERHGGPQRPGPRT